MFIKQTQQLVNEQIQDQFSSHLIKNISLNQEMLKDDNIDIFIQSLSHAQFLKINKICGQNLLLTFIHKFNNLSQLEGLHLLLAYHTHTVQEFKMLSEVLVQLPNLKNFAFFLQNQHIDYQHIWQSLSEGLFKLNNLEVITLDFTTLNYITIQGMKSILAPLKCLHKLTTLNVDISFQKQHEESSNLEDLQELIKGITSFTQLKILNIRFLSYFRRNNKDSISNLYLFDVSKLINLTILSINITQINIYLHIDLKDLQNQITNLTNLEQLYINIYNRTFSSQEIAPLFDSSVALAKLKIFQFYIQISKLRQENKQKAILLGSKKIESSNLKELTIYLQSSEGRKKLQFTSQLQFITKLEVLSLSLQNIQLSEDQFLSISNWIQNCSLLRVFKLQLKQKKYPQSFLKSLGTTFAQLKNLVEIFVDIKFRNYKLQELLIEAIANASNLEVLSIFCDEFFLDQDKDKMHNQLSKVIHLKQFKINICKQISVQESINFISKTLLSLKQITKFDCRLNHFSNLSYKEFSQNLNSLENVRDFSIYLGEYSELTHQHIDDLFQGIAQLLKLEYLEIRIISESYIKTAWYDMISQRLSCLKKLRGLKLTSLLNKNLKFFKKLPYLVLYKHY